MAWCFVVLSAVLWYGLVNDLAFSADGAYYFSKVLDLRDFYSNAWSREHSNLMSQWPLVVAVRLGITDLSLLTPINGVSLYLPFVASFGLCMFALRGLDKTPLLFPLASMLLVTFPAAFILVGESHFMALATWPILLLILRPTLGHMDAAVLVGSLLILCRTYETAFASGGLFIALGVLRLRYGPPGNRRALIAAMAAALVVVGVGSYWTAFPANSVNRNSFLHSLVLPLRHPLFLCSLAALSLLTWAVARRASWAYVASFAIAALAVVLPLGGIAATANVSFACRTLTLTLLPALLLAASFLYVRGFRLERGALLATMTVMTLLGVANAVSWQGWIEFREEFRGTLRGLSGYVAVEDTALFRSGYRWNWTSPLLSILWSDGCVRTIVLSPARVRWEPFDPRTTLPMQRYVRFAMPLASTAPAAPTCR
jgi:hypothetical protein